MIQDFHGCGFNEYEPKKKAPANGEFHGFDYVVNVNDCVCVRVCVIHTIRTSLELIHTATQAQKRTWGGFFHNLRYTDLGIYVKVA